MDEKHPINSQSPYAASKASADQLALSYHRSFDLPVKIIRPFNTYGPRQSERAIIPTIIKQALQNNSKKLDLGNLTPTRDFSYVDDTVNAFIEVMKNKKIFGQVLNVGSNQKISISSLSEEIMKLTNKKRLIKINSKRKRPKLSEVDNLQCNNEKIKKITNWKPKTNLKEGLKKTLEWIKKNQNFYNNQYII